MTYEIGQPIQNIWNKEREGTFRVTKKTTKRDWNQQLKVAKEQSTVPISPSEAVKDAEYFRVTELPL